MKSRKGQVAIYITFMFVAMLIVLIAAVLAPLGVRFNSEAYVAGEDILLRANGTIAQIQNDTVRQSILSGTQEGLDAVEDNININNSIFKYGWVIVVFLTALIVFLFTRRLTEVNRGFV